MRKRTLWTKEDFITHGFIPRKKGSTQNAVGANTELVRIEFENGNKARTQALSSL